MDDRKMKFNEAVAVRLGAAPVSAEKDELIEELSDNLYRRFLDMTNAGMDEDAAFNRSLEDLGDVDELLAYLGVEPAPDVVINDGERQTQIKTEDGQTVIINNPDSDPAIIDMGDKTPGDGEAQDGQDAQPQGRTDERGDVHYDYNPDASQSDLDAIFANVSEVCRIAMNQVKDAAKQAKDAIQRRTTVEKNKGHVKVHFNSSPDEPVPPAPPPPPPPPHTPKKKGGGFLGGGGLVQGRLVPSSARTWSMASAMTKPRAASSLNGVSTRAEASPPTAPVSTERMDLIWSIRMTAPIPSPL